MFNADTYVFLLFSIPVSVLVSGMLVNVLLNKALEGEYDESSGNHPYKRHT